MFVDWNGIVVLWQACWRVTWDATWKSVHAGNTSAAQSCQLLKWSNFSIPRSSDLFSLLYPNCQGLKLSTSCISPNCFHTHFPPLSSIILHSTDITLINKNISFFCLKKKRSDGFPGTIGWSPWHILYQTHFLQLPHILLHILSMCCRADTQATSFARVTPQRGQTPACSSRLKLLQPQGNVAVHFSVCLLLLQAILKSVCTYSWDPWHRKEMFSMSTIAVMLIQTQHQANAHDILWVCNE